MNTQQTNAEISKALALAIGYAPEDVQLVTSRLDESVQYVMVRRESMVRGGWTPFDYRSTSVIWPIAVKYHKMPSERWKFGQYIGEWYCEMPSSMGTSIVTAETPEKAVALAVIAMHKEQ